jgi:hypothetical protein
MREPSGERRSPVTAIVAGAGVGGFAVVCCASLPLVVGLVGGLTLAGVLGVGGGVLAAAAVVALGLVVVRARRRRACAAEDPIATATGAKR